MDSFYIDKLGNDDGETCHTHKSEDEDDDSDDFLNTKKIDLFDKFLDKLNRKEKKEKKNEFNFDNTYLITNYKGANRNKIISSSVDKMLEKSVIEPGFEKLHSVPLEKSKKALKLERKKLREKTKGEKWFDMPATELTPEIKNDFKLLKMRSVLDKNHVYKKNDITRIPKYFQVGKVVESAADFYGGRIPKSQRKKTLVDELLADAEFKKRQKKKFKEIMDENRRKKRTKKNLKKKGKLKK